jgi:predicted nuclease with TOPRIM domain
MISFIFNPLIFFSVLLVLFGVAMYVGFNVLRQDSKYKNMDTALEEKEAAKNELAKKNENLEKEIEKLNKDLSLKDELYRGLKGQYGELEKDMERLIAQSQSTESVQAKIEEPAPKPSIVDLLKSLNKTEKT